MNTPDSQITSREVEYQGPSNTELNLYTYKNGYHLGRLAVVGLLSVGSVLVGSKVYQEVAKISDTSYNIDVLNLED